MNEFPIFINWLDSYTREATKNIYTMGLKNYCEWLDKSPDELISEAEDEQDKMKMRSRHIGIYLNKYRDELTNKKLAPYTIKTYLTAVKSFYTFNYIDLPKIKIERAKCLPENRDIPMKEDIRKALSVCSPLEKAIILVGISSGLGAQEICNLKISDFKKGYDPETGITQLKLLRIKENVQFVTYLTPEATKAVIEYLNYRERTAKQQSEKRKDQLLKQKITDDDNYLFCLKNVPAEYLDSHDDEKRKISKHSVIQIYQRISEKSQTNTKHGKYGLLRSHNIRKMFNSTLLNEGCDFFHAEQFLGHTLPSTQENYFRASPDKLKEVYKKYVPYLTVQKELDLSESPEYTAIKEENDILRAETAKHIVERQEIIALKNEVAKGAIERAELNALKTEIESMYREMRDTKEGFNIGTRLVHKIHPHRLILPPDDGSEVDPDL
jgi:Site-specific recombinase XerD